MSINYEMLQVLGKAFAAEAKEAARTWENEAERRSRRYEEAMKNELR